MVVGALYYPHSLNYFIMDNGTMDNSVDTKLEVIPVDLENHYGYSVRMYIIGPFLISNLMDFRSMLSIAFNDYYTSIKYIAQGKDGYIAAYQNRPVAMRNSESYLSGVRPKTFEMCLQRRFPIGGASVRGQRTSLEGVTNYGWAKALVPKYFIMQAQEAIEVWYQQFDNSSKVMLGTAYSIAMRKYMHNRKLKSVSKQKV